LRNYPELGRPLEELPEVCDLVAGDYIVRYILGEETVTILRIWHGRGAR